MLGAGAGDAAGDNLAAFGNEIAQHFGILVVQRQFLVSAEAAEFAARGEFFLECHLCILRSRFVGQFDSQELCKPRRLCGMLRSSSATRGWASIDQAHIIAAHLFMHGIGQVAHTPGATSITLPPSRSMTAQKPFTNAFLLSAESSGREKLAGFQIPLISCSLLSGIGSPRPRSWNCIAGSMNTGRNG